MNWIYLLSGKRFGETDNLSQSETRSRFEQDYDRIIFSHPFRKLQDKTQVFPLPEDDFVHTRLTHSLEVSSVGRSLGKEVGNVIIEKDAELKRSGFTYNDFGAVTAAASLAHDLGNPPFGHSGESGISTFFSNTGKGKLFKELISEKEWSDLTHFEGNAQGFRILNSSMYGGLKLTYATLAAFTKYPKDSSTPSQKGRKSQKKYGFTQSEQEIFESIANELGLIEQGDKIWCRHPLTFLVEAADDICYNIIDLEDGTRLGLVPFEDTKRMLADIIGKRFSEEKLNRIPDLNEQLGTLRALAIHQLITEVKELFLENNRKIMEGTFDSALTDMIPSASALKTISDVSIKKIYRSKQVLEREAAGYEVIEKLMEGFTYAVYFTRFRKEEKSPKHVSLYRLLPEAIQYEIEHHADTVFTSMQVVTDFISSLTDSSALKLYKTIGGFRI